MPLFRASEGILAKKMVSLGSTLMYQRVGILSSRGVCRTCSKECSEECCVEMKPSSSHLCTYSDTLIPRASTTSSLLGFSIAGIFFLGCLAFSTLVLALRAESGVEAITPADLETGVSLPANRKTFSDSSLYIPALRQGIIQHFTC